ncbi:MAG: hypothetical protein COZ96_09620 [Nitrospirae bacterium CG_4_8_14_3_um_filter_70_85]|nr:MAG: hypothetical protein COS73_04480 [Nitrospirae bacterium CG06_land_8_20_14_3_00_70_43]PIW82261.1 MAG: hypothetical protein COZ96_09620 [Nitrospirae bacterium CG_4_8_14_3_um_filter_70_85]PIX83121.1 MAG: hypothetical protein COZ33_07090 [Nitrospirae bacterium CG_4_10_14_3_um_filter_70_108]
MGIHRDLRLDAAKEGEGAHPPHPGGGCRRGAGGEGGKLLLRRATAERDRGDRGGGGRGGGGRGSRVTEGGEVVVAADLDHPVRLSPRTPGSAARRGPPLRRGRRG